MRPHLRRARRRPGASRPRCRARASGGRDDSVETLRFVSQERCAPQPLPLRSSQPQGTKKRTSDCEMRAWARASLCSSLRSHLFRRSPLHDSPSLWDCSPHPFLCRSFPPGLSCASACCWCRPSRTRSASTCTARLRRPLRLHPASTSTRRRRLRRPLATTTGSPFRLPRWCSRWIPLRRHSGERAAVPRRQRPAGGRRHQTAHRRRAAARRVVSTSRPRSDMASTTSLPATTPATRTPGTCTGSSREPASPSAVRPGAGRLRPRRLRWRTTGDRPSPSPAASPSTSAARSTSTSCRTSSSARTWSTRRSTRSPTRRSGWRSACTPRCSSSTSPGSPSSLHRTRPDLRPVWQTTTTGLSAHTSQARKGPSIGTSTAPSRCPSSPPDPGGYCTSTTFRFPW